MSWAEGPAVSALNGKVSAEGGAINSGRTNAALAIAQGTITTPLGQIGRAHV